MSITERQADLLKIIESIDISPSMYKNAVEKYTSLTKYLGSHGLKATMYPQGSFALGTVTRPYNKEHDRNYDLDFICQVDSSRDEISPKDLRDKIKDILESGELYGGKLTINDECFTIEYADIGSIGFSIDIVPAADETYKNKLELKKESHRPDLIETAIAIPRFSQQRVYNWITNNPKGYREWFSEMNLPFANYSYERYRQQLYKNNMELFNSVEEIPTDLYRSSMQRVIQILKYHRDVYYSRVKDGDDLKPISAIINTVVARIASKAAPTLSPIELLDYVLKEFSIYAKQMNQTEQSFKQMYSDKLAIQKRNNKWIIENPANPEDNLADKWNLDSRIPKLFFSWAEAAKDQLVDSLFLSDADFRAKVETAFGRSTVQNGWGSKYNPEPPRIIPSHNSPKPWRLM